MSVGGILATALAGGANVIGKQAGDDIEAGRRTDLMRQQAEIEEQMRMRLAEMDERRASARSMAEVSGPLAEAKLDFGRRAGEQAAGLSLKSKVDEAKNPELAAAKDTQAEAELQRDIKRINATAGPEADKAVKIAEARARIEVKYRKADPTVQGNIANMEKALGRSLTEVEKLAAMGLAPKGRDPEMGYETVVTKTYDANGNETGSRTQKLPMKAGQGGGEPEVDKLKATMDAARAAREKKPSPAKQDEAAPSSAAAAGPGMLKGLSGGTGRSQAGAITEDPPRRGYPGGFIFNGQKYPTLEAAKAARGY